MPSNSIEKRLSEEEIPEFLRTPEFLEARTEGILRQGMENLQLAQAEYCKICVMAQRAARGSYLDQLRDAQKQAKNSDIDPCCLPRVAASRLGLSDVVRVIEQIESVLSLMVYPGCDRPDHCEELMITEMAHSICCTEAERLQAQRFSVCELPDPNKACYKDGVKALNTDFRTLSSLADVACLKCENVACPSNIVAHRELRSVICASLVESGAAYGEQRTPYNDH